MKYPALFTLIFLSHIAVAQLPLPPTIITLSWSTPAQRENGDTLTAEEISGYKLLSSCGDSVEITGNTTSYTLPIALPFDCNFTVVAVDTDGLHPKPSNELRVAFNAPAAPILDEVQIN